MKSVFVSLSLLAAPVLMISPAMAQETPAQRAASFDKADKNHDGKLTKEEWISSIPAKARDHVEEAWKRMDPDSKGYMTKDAYVAFTGAPIGLGTTPPKSN